MRNGGGFVKPKTLTEAVKAEKLKVLSQKKRAQLEDKLRSLACEKYQLRKQLEEDDANRLRLQWLKRGWMARD